MLTDSSSNVVHDAEPAKNLSFTEVFCLTQMGLQN
jgi:hypothetical protein